MLVCLFFNCFVGFFRCFVVLFFFFFFFFFWGGGRVSYTKYQKKFLEKHAAPSSRQAIQSCTSTLNSTTPVHWLITGLDNLSTDLRLGV